MNQTPEDAQTSSWAEVMETATTHARPQARAKAVFRLRNRETVEVVRTLGAVALADAHPGVRKTAVQSLFDIGRTHAELDTEVLLALQGAASDSDPDVAADARAALLEIQSRQATRRTTTE